MRALLIEELSTSDKLTSSIRNQFGNFVVQKSLKIAQGRDREKLIAAIRSKIPEINDRKIRMRWEQIVSEAPEGRP